MRELLLEIWTSVRRNKLRTFLTGFSVAWGIFMLVILLGSGNGLKNGVLANFGTYATNTVSISGGWTSQAYAGYGKWRHISLKNNDLKIFREEFPEIVDVAGTSWYRGSTASYGERFADIILRGVLPGMQRIQGTEIVKGRYINEADIRAFRKVIVIDEALERLLFPGEEPLGKEIKIQNVIYRVAGVYKGDAQQRNSLGYIPITTGQLIFKGGDQVVDNIVVTVEGLRTDAEMEAFERRIRTRMAAEHHFDATDESALWIWNTIEQVRNMMALFHGIALLTWIVGLGTLLAGIVGVSNIMLVLVKERTQEIGIRRAIGAPPAAIISQILSESFVLTFIAGVLGLAAAVGVLSLADSIYYQTVTVAQEGAAVSWQVSFGTGMLALFILVAGSLLAGVIPATRALKIKAVDAIREE